MKSILLTLLFLIASLSFAQDGKVRVSPKAGVMQTVGFTDVEIIYSRPAVKERKIWGTLVPYGSVWRAGANEATKIIFSDDVKINGKKISKGEYSFFAIPAKDEWVLIFNKDAEQWGAFSYNEAEDALRIKVKPVKEKEHIEWLTYSLNKISNTTAEVHLKWEKLKIPFKIEAPLKK